MQQLAPSMSMALRPHAKPGVESQGGGVSESDRFCIVGLRQAWRFQNFGRKLNCARHPHVSAKVGFFLLGLFDCSSMIRPKLIGPHHIYIGWPAFMWDEILHWAEIQVRDGAEWGCAYCLRGVQPGRDRHLDHVIPRALGGPTKSWNLVQSCASCNLKKGMKLMLPDQIPAGFAAEAPAWARKQGDQSLIAAIDSLLSSARIHA